MTVKGIDVASYQSEDYSTKGLDFVFIKITEGSSYVNPKWVDQRQTARDAELVTGFYHFVRSGSMSGQADYFLSKINLKLGDVLALDWEDPDVSGADKDSWIKYVQGKAPGHRVVLYCNRDYWFNRDATSFCGDGLWVADPGAAAGKPRVEHAWTFHQYSTSGGVDHNVGNFASRDKLHTWAVRG
jgi:GH25 family lysozyme M1 (1,4-beta-N-acetylmuramidase)